MAAKGSPLFTLDLMVDLGGRKDQRTQRMVSVLNNLTRFWGIDAKAYMQEFINMVKSRTDTLAVTLEPPSKPNGIIPADLIKELTEANKKSSEQIQTLLADKTKIEARYKELNSILSKSGSSVQHTQKKTDSLNEKALLPVIGSYMLKCKELDRLKHESARHSIWYNEKVRKFELEKSGMESTVNDLNREIKGLKVAFAAKVPLIMHQVKNVLLNPWLAQSLLQQDLIEKELKARTEQRTRYLLVSWDVCMFVYTI